MSNSTYETVLSSFGPAIERAKQSFERAFQAGLGYELIVGTQALDTQNGTLEPLYGIQTPAGIVTTREPQRVLDIATQADLAWYEHIEAKPIAKRDDNKSFAVGDEVSYGFNGDYYPAVVVRVAKSFVEVERLECVIDDLAVSEQGYVPGERFQRGMPGVSFERRSRAVVERFYRKGDGRYGMAGLSGGWYLSHGAVSAFNPHF